MQLRNRQLQSAHTPEHALFPIGLTPRVSDNPAPQARRRLALGGRSKPQRPLKDPSQGPLQGCTLDEAPGKHMRGCAAAHQAYTYIGFPKPPDPSR